MVDAPERIWIEQDDCPYFYEESELAEVSSPVTEYVRADLYAAPYVFQKEVDMLQAELSGNTGELIDRMAEAIRDWGSHYDDGPWETLPEDRKAGWRGDAERALAVVKEYLTAPRAYPHRGMAGKALQSQTLSTRDTYANAKQG